VEIREAEAREPMRIVFQNGVALHFSERLEPEWIMELMRLVS
jgi:hypothetical protein